MACRRAVSDCERSEKPIIGNQAVSPVIAHTDPCLSWWSETPGVVVLHSFQG